MQASSQRSSQRLSRSTVPSTPAYNELHCKGFVILRGEVSRSDCRKLRDGATRECYEPILRDKLRLVAFNATLAPLATRRLNEVRGSDMAFVVLLLIPPFTCDCRCWVDTGSLTAATAQRRVPVTSLCSSRCRAYPLPHPLAKRHSWGGKPHTMTRRSWSQSSCQGGGSSPSPRCPIWTSHSPP